MHKLSKLFQLVVMSCLLTACAITGSDSNEDSDKEKAKKFTDVAIAYFRSADNVNARNWLQKALGYDKTYARAYSILGSVFQSEKELVLAEQYFKKSISYDSKSAMFRNNYGAFLFQQKRYAEACVQLDLATKDPFYNRRASALNNLGRCYAAVKEDKKASAAFQRSVNLGGRNTYALLNISKTLLETGEIFKSTAKYAEFLQLISENKAKHTAESLMLGIKLARVNGNSSDVVTYSLLLENLFPKKYKQFKESVQ